VLRSLPVHVAPQRPSRPRSSCSSLEGPRRQAARAGRYFLCRHSWRGSTIPNARRDSGDEGDHPAGRNRRDLDHPLQRAKARRPVTLHRAAVGGRRRIWRPRRCARCRARAVGTDGGASGRGTGRHRGPPDRARPICTGFCLDACDIFGPAGTFAAAIIIGLIKGSLAGHLIQKNRYDALLKREHRTCLLGECTWRPLMYYLGDGAFFSLPLLQEQT
jgi:hypothetical protein